MTHYGYCPVCGVEVWLDCGGFYICADGHKVYETMNQAQREEWLEKARKGEEG